MLRKSFKYILFIIIIFVINIFLGINNTYVYGKITCPNDCIKTINCAEGCSSEYACPSTSSGSCCCLNPKPQTSDDNEGLSIFSEGADWLFGSDSLIVNLIKPPTLFNMEGTASIASIGIFIVSFLWWILIVATFAAGAIGAMKWVSSGGEESKVQSAKKWTVNAVTGFGVAIAIFLIANFFTWILGMGNVFDLTQNLAVCGEGDSKKTLLDWKRENDQLDAENCKCYGYTWGCN